MSARSCRRLGALAAVVGIATYTWARWFQWGQGTELPPYYCTAQTAPFPAVPDPASPEALRRWASALVQQMTAREKYDLVNGLGWFGYSALPGYYIGNILATPRLGLPAIQMQDAMQGFRTIDARIVGQVTSWPCALAIASTWNGGATWRWARAIGEEFRVKGANMILGPSVNVHRVPYNGRNAEYLSGEEPYLGRRLAPAYVRGAQEGAGIGAVLKHFVLNQQETERSKVDSVVDERTLWELYYPPFEATVGAGVSAVMCSYNFVNGEQACENNSTLTVDLKTRMGFQGWVMSDWDALQSRRAARAGTDMDQPGTDGFFSEEALATLPPARLDDMATRVLSGMARIPAFREPRPETSCRAGCNCSGLIYNTMATSDAHLALARRLAAEGAVLLKNDAAPRRRGGAGSPGRVLPLRAGQTVAVVGSACDARPVHLTWATRWTDGDYYSIGGSGRVLSNRTASVLTGLIQAGLALRVSATDSTRDAKHAMRGADVVLTCGGATAAESFDRSSLLLDQDDFIDWVVRRASKLEMPAVVVALAPGAVVLPWHERAAAVLLLFLSGEATGLAAADVLTGAVGPAGRLPVTIPSSERHALQPCDARSSCEYSEKLRGGWHLYDSLDVAYPFGHGLSYTDFSVAVVSDWAPRLSSGWELVVRITNVGSSPGVAVPQLFLQFPGGDDDRPAWQLRGFNKSDVLAPGASWDTAFSLESRDLSQWDTRSHSWRLVEGQFRAFVGASSRDMQLCGGFSVDSGLLVDRMQPCSGSPFR